MSKLPFHVIIKPVGDVCNLNCSYCFYKEKSESGKIMPDDVLEKLTQKYISEQPQQCKEVQFVWQGGEPMLAGIDFYRKALEFQRQHIRHGMKITNALQTNGSLITNEWADFLKENEFLVGISIDGNQAVHDDKRIYYSGKGSYEKVVAGYHRLKDRKIATNILCVVHPENVTKGREIYLHLAQELSAKNIQFLPVVGDYSLSAKGWGEFLKSVFDEWLEFGLGKVSVQHFDTSYSRIVQGVETFCVHAYECGNQLAVERNGDVFSCDHFVDDEHCLGNVQEGSFTEMLASPLQKRFRDNSKMHDSVCSHCDIKGLCQSGCPKHRDSTHKNKLCEGYYAFYKHSIPYFYAIAECQKRRMNLSSYNLFVPNIKLAISGNKSA